MLSRSRTSCRVNLGRSLGILCGEPVDDMNESLDTLAGCHSALHGPLPTLSGYPDAGSELSVATMHRMKGLEFRCVAVVGVGVGVGQVPPPSAVTPAEEDRATHDLDIQRERCLLLVACTRAREELAVSWHGKPSPLLPSATA
jgi:hypothetical protein